MDRTFFIMMLNVRMGFFPGRVQCILFLTMLKEANNVVKLHDIYNIYSYDYTIDKNSNEKLKNNMHVHWTNSLGFFLLAFNEPTYTFNVLSFSFLCCCLNGTRALNNFLSSHIPFISLLFTQRVDHWVLKIEHLQWVKD